MANLPFVDQSVDVIVDIYSPANYAEFKQVLKPDGLLIKVVPTAAHVQELRELAGDQLQSKEYSNQRLLDLFEEHFQILSRQEVTTRHTLTPDAQEALVQMTPLLFYVDKTRLQQPLAQVTISGEIVVGRAK